MSADAKPKPPAGHPKRRIRNFLLDTRFQLKYTGMVVAVTILVTSAVGVVLGQQAYQYSKGMSEMLTMQQGMGMEVDNELQQLLEEEAVERDLEVLTSITLGLVALIAILAVALGMTGIIVTHKVVGPAYKLKLQLGDLAAGDLNIRGGFRKGDELQDVGEAFKNMMTSLRSRREDELADLGKVVESAQAAGIDPAVLTQLESFQGQLLATLKGKA